jgi:AMMECR1 domain-containing protein
MSAPFPSFPYPTLDRPLAESERRELAAGLRALLRFQHTLATWTPIRRAPDATPFVSLYAKGSLRGCYGSSEGDAPERLMRAFLRAQDDARFGGISPAQRAGLAAQVSYPRAARLVDPATAAAEIEPGTHGVALVRDRAPAVLLLPNVARDEGLGAAGLLQALHRKAGVAGDDHGGTLYLFETCEVTVHPEPDPPGARRAPTRTPEDLAAAWLASLVGEDGRVAFAVDPRRRQRHAFGVMAHGRAAVVIQALAAHGRHRPLVSRARERLARDIRAALGGAAIADWPADPAMVAGTLALAVLAGAALDDELAALAAGPDVARVPWHAAQVVAALGARAPAALWKACVEDLDRRPWAPWTVIAASARGDRPVRARAARAVADALRKTPPHRGGAEGTPIPEVALTALSVEALAHHPAPWARAAAARGREFLGALQLVGSRVYGALDPALCRGAFPASPVVDLLRGDVTGHALLAMLAS